MVDASDVLHVLQLGSCTKNVKIKPDKFRIFLPCLFFKQTFTLIAKKQRNAFFKGAFPIKITSITSQLDLCDA